MFLSHRACLMSAACGLAFGVCAETTITNLPEASTFVHIGERGKLHRGIVADSYRDGVMRLDVSGMANVTNATLRLYVTQHNDKDTKPMILRQMNDVDWLESKVTMDSLAHEFPNGLTAWTAADDPSVIGYCRKVPGLYQWAEFDITAAVKREAARSGKLAFVISAMGFRGFNNTATCFADASYADPSKRPQFVVSWAEGETRGTKRQWVCCPVTDEFTVENSGATIRVDGLYLAGNGREAYFKFDLSGLAGQGKVRRAVMKFPQYEFTNKRSVQAYLHRNANDTWTEADYPAGSRGSRTYPNGLIYLSSVSESSIRCRPFGGEWQTNFVNETEITAFVQAAVAEGKCALSVSLTSPDGYAIGASHRNELNVDPVQLWVDMAETEDAPAATPDWAYYPQESRTAIHYALVNNFSDKDRNNSSANETNTTSQTGSSDSGTTKRVLDTFFLFDPKGLENTPYVRLRLKVAETTNVSSDRRLFGRETPYWHCEKVTWNNMMPEFDGSRVDKIEAGTLYPNALYSIGHYIGAVWSKTEFIPYIEADVTEVVHRAAREGKHVTFMLGAVDNSGWTWYHNEKAAAEYRPKLVYPAIRGFANQLAATTGTAADGHKTAVIAWTPSETAGATYAVARREVGKADVEALAANLTEPTYTDAKARSDRAYVYTVTATLPDETVQAAAFTNRIDNTVTVTNVLDGFVRNGKYKSNAAQWLDRVIVMKDGDGGSKDIESTREGFVRFALADVPADARRITFTLHNGDLGAYDNDEELYFRVVNDIDKTDANPPTWYDLLGNAVGATSSSASGIFFSRSFSTDPLTPNGDVEVDVTAQVLAAKRNGDSHILFHVFVRDPDCSMNFGWATKESPYVSSAPRLLCEKPSWAGGLCIFVR